MNEAQRIFCSTGQLPDIAENILPCGYIGNSLDNYRLLNPGANDMRDISMIRLTPNSTISLDNNTLTGEYNNDVMIVGRNDSGFVHLTNWCDFISNCNNGLANKDNCGQYWNTITNSNINCANKSPVSGDTVILIMYLVVMAIVLLIVIIIIIFAFNRGQY